MVWSISEPLSVGSLNSKFLHLTAFLHEDQEGGEATFQVNEAIENYLK